MKVIIHSCDKRLWYVNEFLVPALREQGINPQVRNDDAHRGNLWAYIDSFKSLRGDDEGAWHLEDDVYPSRRFARTAQAHDHGVVFGFYHRFGEEEFIPGWCPVAKAGYSFPCFRMPNRIAVEFAEWFLTEAQHRETYREWIADNKHIDSFMLNFLRERHPEEQIYNLKPSIVEHVDEYIGGSVVNKWRDGWARAEFFDDPEVINELKVKLANRNGSLF